MKLEHLAKVIWLNNNIIIYKKSNFSVLINLIIQKILTFFLMEQIRMGNIT